MTPEQYQQLLTMRQQTPTVESPVADNPQAMSAMPTPSDLPKIPAGIPQSPPSMAMGQEPSSAQLQQLQAILAARQQPAPVPYYQAGIQGMWQGAGATTPLEGAQMIAQQNALNEDHRRNTNASLIDQIKAIQAQQQNATANTQRDRELGIQSQNAASEKAFRDAQIESMKGDKYAPLAPGNGVLDKSSGAVTVPPMPKDVPYEQKKDEQLYQDYLATPAAVQKYGASRMGMQQYMEATKSEMTGQLGQLTKALVDTGMPEAQAKAKAGEMIIEGAKNRQDATAAATIARQMQQETQVRNTAYERLQKETSGAVGPHLDALRQSMDLLNQSDPTNPNSLAASMLAPSLLKALVGGQGSGLRITQSEIQQVMGSSTKPQEWIQKVQSYIAAPDKYQGVPPITVEQAKRLVGMALAKAQSAQHFILDAKSRLDSPGLDSVTANRHVNNAQTAIEAINNGKIPVIAPDNSIHIFNNDAEAQAFKDLLTKQGKPQ